MSAYTGTHIKITDTNQSDSVGGIFWKAVCRNLLRKIITRDKLKGDRQILINQLIHHTFDILLFLTRRLVVKIKTHLTLLPLNMSIIRPFATKQTNHSLVQKMLRSMCRRELFLIMIIQNGIHMLML